MSKQIANTSPLTESELATLKELQRKQANAYWTPEKRAQAAAEQTARWNGLSEQEKAEFTVKVLEGQIKALDSTKKALEAARKAANKSSK